MQPDVTSSQLKDKCKLSPQDLRFPLPWTFEQVWSTSYRFLPVEQTSNAIIEQWYSHNGHDTTEEVGTSCLASQHHNLQSSYLNKISTPPQKPHHMFQHMKASWISPLSANKLCVGFYNKRVLSVSTGRQPREVARAFIIGGL